MLPEQRLDHRGIAEQDELAVRMARQRDRGAGHDHGRAVVTSHGVERNSDLLRHGSATGLSVEARSDATDGPGQPGQ